MVRSIFAFTVFAFALSSSPAMAMKFSLVGAANLSTPEASPATVTYSAVPDFGGGALLEFGLVPSVGLEFGGLYLKRNYDKANGFSKINTKLTMWQFPVVLKAYLADVLSLGIGGYYSKYKDDVHLETRTAAGTAFSRSSLSTELQEDSDYGLVTSLGIYIPFGTSARFMVDGRYNIGVKDNSTSSTELKYNDMQVLVGFQFGM